MIHLLFCHCLATITTPPVHGHLGCHPTISPLLPPVHHTISPLPPPSSPDHPPTAMSTVTTPPAHGLLLPAGFYIWQDFEFAFIHTPDTHTHTHTHTHTPYTPVHIDMSPALNTPSPQSGLFLPCAFAFASMGKTVVADFHTLPV